MSTSHAATSQLSMAIPPWPFRFTPLGVVRSRSAREKNPLVANFSCSFRLCFTREAVEQRSNRSTHASWRWARNISHVQSVVGSVTRSAKRKPSRRSSSCCIVPGCDAHPSPTDRGRLPERAGVAVQRRLAAQVRVQHARPRLDPTVADEIDERRHRLSLVHRIGEHPFEAGTEPDCLDRLSVGDPIGAGVPLIEQDDLAVGERATEADRLGGSAGNPRDLIPCLLDGRRAVDAEHRAFVSPARRSRRSFRPASSR